MDRRKHVIETISWVGTLQDTGDKEAATKTITATSEAAGTGNADYNHALTVTKPTDIRLVMKRIAARLSVTIDSFDTATHLYCRVYVDAQDADHKLFDMDWDSTGTKLTAVDTTSSAYATIFNLLSDGAAHTFYFFFWVNQANNAIISLVELWTGCGTCSTSGAVCLWLNHKGYVSIGAYHDKTGTGTISFFITPRDASYANTYLVTKSGGGGVGVSNCLINNADIALQTTVNTDITNLHNTNKITLHTN